MLKKKLGIEGIEIGYPSYFYFKTPSTLIIPEGCREIGDDAFRKCKGLKKVVIPKSVVEIGNFYFF